MLLLFISYLKARLRRESSDNSAEEEDRRQRRDNEGRIDRGWGGGNKEDKEEEYNSCWRMAGKVASAPEKRRGGCNCVVL